MQRGELTQQYSALRGFEEHGVNFTRVFGSQAVGDCPLCGKEGHLYANHTTRQWDCKVCGCKGGFGQFLRLAGEANAEGLANNGNAMSRLSEARGLTPATMLRWGVGWNGEFYTVPVRSLDPASKHLIDLRIYRIGSKTRSSSGGKVGLVGCERMGTSGRVWLCEGEWDAMAMDEMLRAGGVKEPALGLTGAEQFRAEWASAFQGRDVVVVFDNDEAGVRGENKVHAHLRGACRSIRFVHWPVENTKGYDLRDYHTSNAGGLEKLYEYIHDKPRAAPSVSGVDAESGPDPDRPSGHGMSADEVVAGYRRWFHMPDADPIHILYGTVLANRLRGDPVWLFIVADAGGFKTELVMSLEKAPLITTCSTLTPHSLVSGSTFQGGGDPSLIPKLNGKVLTIKDFTVILSMHYSQRDEIFSVLRDAYDGRTEKVFGTGVHRIYESRFGLIAAVTGVIDQLNSANVSLGERFLRCRLRVPGGVTRASETIRRAINNSVTIEDTARTEIKKLAASALDIAVDPDKHPKIGPLMVARFVGLAQWTACLRGVVVREKYTGDMPHRPVVEVGTRLGKQFAKLAMGIALFNHRDVVTDFDYRLVLRVARDTVPGIVEEIVQHLYTVRDNGFTSSGAIAEMCGMPHGTVMKYMQDLGMLKALERDPMAPVRGGWRLSRQMVRVMNLIAVK